MLVRAFTYRTRGMETLLKKAVSGGCDGVLARRMGSGLCSNAKLRSSTTWSARARLGKLTQLAANTSAKSRWCATPPRQRQELMGVMMLAAGKGAKVTLETDGRTRRTLDALVALIGDCFGEGQ